MRFWISVESLNRPPTLFTMPSSFSSSSIFAPLVGCETHPNLRRCVSRILHFEQGTENRPHGREGGFQVVVDHLIIILAGTRKFHLSILHAALDRFFRIGMPFSQALLEHLETRGANEDGHGIGAFF